MSEPSTRKCPHCNHKWILRVKKPKRCPNCGIKLNHEKPTSKGA